MPLHLLPQGATRMDYDPVLRNFSLLTHLRILTLLPYLSSSFIQSVVKVISYINLMTKTKV